MARCHLYGCHPRPVNGCFSSHGDAHPSLAPGRAPRARGHRVTFLTNGDFGPLVRRFGFEAPGTTSRPDVETRGRGPARAGMARSGAHASEDPFE
jgi:UDP:flavonoid glycosyltransferase YjiC (YdhE family)